MTENPIRPTIPPDADGVHHGYLNRPFRRDDSAWGSVMVPITVIANGRGTTAARLTGGNHGGEYEGRIAAQDPAMTLRPEDITGRVIVLPMMNAPAFAVGRRCSPIRAGFPFRRADAGFPALPGATAS
ncbi:hypothetical protein [Jannaschia rubra]|uniref:hypothetical protein n=1 Tax=Jannaschia rubra TaxID=282197 RepID=UPI003CD0CC6F